MDHWERRLQLTARSLATRGHGSTSLRARRPFASASGRPLEAPPGGEVADLIHPDEAPVVGSLLAIAQDRPGFRAEITLLARNHDRWEYHRFEVVGEVMGPVIRVVDGVDVVLGPDRDEGTSGRDHEVPAHPSQLARSALLERVGAALERVGDGSVAVLLVDLDRFKPHNDLLGAELGDELLEAMAGRVAAAAAPSFAAAVGGDEFAVVVDRVGDREEATALAERIRAAIVEPIEIGGDRLTITATVGVALGGTGVEPDHLLRDADTALFAGKDHGRDRVEVFGTRLEARVARQVSTAQQLRRALSAGTLELHYQPVYDLVTGRVAAAEALMRVSDGGHGALSPAALIDAAEDSGLVARLGRYLLEETTSQLALWGDRLGDDEFFRVSVNISPVQLTNNDLIDALRHALDAARVSPRRLSLELTGSVVLGLTPAVDAVLAELTKMGVVLGLDDFGTDASSLGGLRRFPVRFVKIDRELVQAIDHDPRAEAIVAATVTLAHRLDMSTIAVGVERPSQHDLLASLGCDAAQGYLYSPPLDARAFTELL